MALVTAATEPRHEIVGVHGGGWFRDRGRDAPPRHPDGLTRLDDLAARAPRRRRPSSRRPAVRRHGLRAADAVRAGARARGRHVRGLHGHETWAGDVHPVQALRDYRARSGIDARLVVVGMVSNGFAIADPDDAGMLDVVGFDTATRAHRRLRRRDRSRTRYAARPAPVHRSGTGATAPGRIVDFGNIIAIMPPMSTTTTTAARHRPDRGRPRLQPLLHRPHRRAARRPAGDAPYPLPEARVLFELGAPREHRRRRPARRVLDLDGGYLSRLLARLEATGPRRPRALARRRPAPAARAHGRRPRGLRDARRALRRGDRRAPRRARRRRPQPACSRRWRRSARSSTARPGRPRFVLRAPRARRLRLGRPSPRHALRRARLGHGLRGPRRARRRRLRRDHDPAREAAWIAEAGGARSARSSACATTTRPRSCACCSSSRAARAWASARALVDACIAFAREAGYRRCACGRTAPSAPRAGSTSARASELVGEETSQKFGQDFTEQDWELALNLRSSPARGPPRPSSPRASSASRSRSGSASRYSGRSFQSGTGGSCPAPARTPSTP